MNHSPSSNKINFQFYYSNSNPKVGKYKYTLLSCRNEVIYFLLKSFSVLPELIDSTVCNRSFAETLYIRYAFNRLLHTPKKKRRKKQKEKEKETTHLNFQLAMDGWT